MARLKRFTRSWTPGIQEKSHSFTSLRGVRQVKNKSNKTKGLLCQWLA